MYEYVHTWHWKCSLHNAHIRRHINSYRGCTSKFNCPAKYSSMRTQIHMNTNLMQQCGCSFGYCLLGVEDFEATCRRSVGLSVPLLPSADTAKNTFSDDLPFTQPTWPNQSSDCPFIWIAMPAYNSFTSLTLGIYNNPQVLCSNKKIGETFWLAPDRKTLNQFDHVVIDCSGEETDCLPPNPTIDHNTYGVG